MARSPPSAAMIDVMRNLETEQTIYGVVESTHCGIQTVQAPQAGGSLAAGLLFRVGRADETLATAGITHLVEHLALHSHGSTDLHFNGSTTDVFTHFYTTGSEAEVVEFLNGVCAALTDLPLSRLETEKQILRAERDTRGTSTVSDHASIRHGANDYGLSSFTELGLANATPERVSDWVAHWFTRENAVLWIASDELPGGLELMLPAGSRFPPPPATNLLAEAPSWYVGNGNMCCLDAAVPRSTAAGLFTAIFRRRLFQNLRHERGLCYTATASYAPRDRDAAWISAVADAIPDEGEAVATGMLDILAALRLGSIDQAELDVARTEVLRDVDLPDFESRRLPSMAMNLLVGHPNLTVEHYMDELKAVTIEDIRKVANAVWADTLIRTPAGDMSWSGATEIPRRMDEPTLGREHLSLDYDGSSIIVGPEGVSRDDAAGCITVLYDDLVAVLKWPDGARVLVDRAGFAVTIEPTVHSVPEEQIFAIDAATPADCAIQMPERPAQTIPRPRPLELPPPSDQPSRSAGAGKMVLAVVLFLTGAVILGAAAVMELQPQTRGRDTGNMLGGVAIALAGLGLAFWLLRPRDEL